MSTKTTEQKLARELQKRLGCSYGFALNTVRNLRPVAGELKAKSPERHFIDCWREAVEAHVKQAGLKVKP